MGKNPPKWLPGERVKETILLQRKSVEQLRVDRLLRRDKLTEQRERRKSKIDLKRKRKLETKKFISAQTILKHALRKRHQARKFAKIGERHAGRRRNQTPERATAECGRARVTLLVRAVGKLVPVEVARGFKRLGLAKLYSARLLLPSTPGALRLIEQLRPFSIVGHPDAAQIDALIRTRGMLWNSETRSRRHISGNMLVEQALGQFNVLCVEDMAQVVASKGEHCAEVLKHLAPFDFHPPRQLYLEKHRTVHQKLEIVNKESFATYLAEQLGKQERVERRVARKAKAAKKAMAPPAKA